MKIERDVLKYLGLVALAGALATAGCEVEEYDFENPFDGSGDLYSFSAVSKPGFVELSWSSMDGVDFDGYAIYRGTDKEAAASGKEAHLLVKKEHTYVMDDDFSTDGERLYYSVSVYRGSVTSGSPQRSKVVDVTVVIDSDGDGIADSKDPNPNQWDCKKESDCPSGMSCSAAVKNGKLVGSCKKDSGSKHGVGGQCTNNAGCNSNLCYLAGKTCLGLCTHGSSDCPSDANCVQFGDGAACFEECYGDKDCSNSLGCVYSADLTSSGLYGLCSQSLGSKSFPDSCTADMQCSSGMCGEGYCLRPCKANYDCPSGSFCGEWHTTLNSKEINFMSCTKGSADPCGGIDFVGLCEGDVVKWCEDGELHVIDCKNLGYGCYCGYKSDAGFYDCKGSCN